MAPVASRVPRGTALRDRRLSTPGIDWGNTSPPRGQDRSELTAGGELSHRESWEEGFRVGSPLQSVAPLRPSDWRRPGEEAQPDRPLPARPIPNKPQRRQTLV